MLVDDSTLITTTMIITRNIFCFVESKQTNNISIFNFRFFSWFAVAIHDKNFDQTKHHKRTHNQTLKWWWWKYPAKKKKNDAEKNGNNNSKREKWFSHNNKKKKQRMENEKKIQLSNESGIVHRTGLKALKKSKVKKFSSFTWFSMFLKQTTMNLKKNGERNAPTQKHTK